MPLRANDAGAQIGIGAVILADITRRAGTLRVSIRVETQIVGASVGGNLKALGVSGTVGRRLTP